MRRVFYILILFTVFFQCFSSLGLSQEFTYSDSILWKSVTTVKSDGTIRTISFDKALFKDSLQRIPLLEKVIRLPFSDKNNLHVSGLDAKWETVPDSLASALPKKNEWKDSICFRYSISLARKIPYVKLCLRTLRLNLQSGKVERLISYVVRISSDENRKSQKIAGTFVGQSVLSSGNWYKCGITQSGIYKITYEQLVSLGLSNPSNVRIFGNGGAQLPEVYSGNVPDDLNEIPIMFHEANSGSFSRGDYILFYAEGPLVWTYDSLTSSYVHQINPFTDTTIYFITESSGGSRVTSSTANSVDSVTKVTSYDGLACHELNTYNFLGSGRLWVGEAFGVQSSFNFSFSFPGLVTSEPIKLESDVYARSVNTTMFRYIYNNTSISSVSIDSVDISSLTSNYASVNSLKTTFLANSSNVTLTLSFLNNGDVNALGYLDFITLNARQQLNYNGTEFVFRDSHSVKNGSSANYIVSGATSTLQVWDISNLHQAVQMNGTYRNDTFSFIAPASQLKTYVAFDAAGNLLTPAYFNNSVLVNQNLHGMSGAPLIIVTNPYFLSEAQELAALHASHDNLQSVVVTTDQIYNEFSSGVTDPAAIRNFVKMFYDRATDSINMPKYLLLFGDGSYDNKTINFSNGTRNSNYIVTYESENSLSQTGSYVSDDYFGMLDDGEEISSGMLDIGIGRLPVRYSNGLPNENEADVIIAKIQRYMSSNNFGNWRNNICFIADAGNSNLHIGQADQLATTVEASFPNFNIDKVYVDAFPVVSTASGNFCPQANENIANDLNNGLLVMNYTGHGNENGLSAEQIITLSSINSWENNYLPLFMTATCEFSRYDNYQQTSGGEQILLNPVGGSIAMLSTTRVVYSEENYDLNSEFYDFVFTKSSENPAYRLGDIIRLTKNATFSDVNKLNFSLLGDPALSLAIPKYGIITDSINHTSINVSDTLKAYDSVNISGHIADINGDTLKSYNGVVYPLLFDKFIKIKTLGNYNDPVFPFQLQNNELFRGEASVINGLFNFHFEMPRDIQYNFGNGKLSYYSTDSSTDATGCFTQVVVGGLTSSSISVDTVGPKVRLFMNDTLFKDGGLTNSYPTLLALISDQNGINIGDGSIGHDIMAVLDFNEQEEIDLNNYYQSDLNDFTKGTVSYKLNDLSAGMHTIYVRVWDNFDNTILDSIHFYVISSTNPTITSVFNCPNP